MDFIPSDLPAENEYPKLVRDNIPNIIRLRHKVEPATRVAEDDAEFVEYLLKKMKEEAAELEYS